jgi:hypothetical protein
MNVNSLLFCILFIITTFHSIQASRLLRIKNQSSFIVEFTIPTTNVSSLLSLVPTTKVILAPNGCTSDLIGITVSDDVHFFWINLPPQLLCSQGRGYEKVNISQFGIKDVDPTYDLFVSAATYHLTWIAVFCCYGFINLPELAASCRRVTCIDPPGTTDDDPVFLCIPIYSPLSDTRQADISAEVDDFIDHIRISTQPS